MACARFFFLLAWMAAGVAQAAHPFDPVARVSDAELDRMRGGFIVNVSGFDFLMAFSLEQLTFINGELVSSVKVNPFALTPLAQLAQVATGDPAALPVGVDVPAPSAAIPATGISDAGVYVAPAAVTSPAAAGETVASVAPAPSAEPSPVSSAAASSPPPVATAAVALPKVTTQGGLTVIQNGPNNAVALPASISPNALTTVIQNTLNDQLIKNVTVMNATIAAQLAAAQAKLNAILNQSFGHLP